MLEKVDRVYQRPLLTFTLDFHKAGKHQTVFQESKLSNICDLFDCELMYNDRTVSIIASETSLDTYGE